MATQASAEDVRPKQPRGKPGQTPPASMRCACRVDRINAVRILTSCPIRPTTTASTGKPRPRSVIQRRPSSSSGRNVHIAIPWATATGENDDAFSSVRKRRPNCTTCPSFARNCRERDHHRIRYVETPSRRTATYLCFPPRHCLSRIEEFDIAGTLAEQRARAQKCQRPGPNNHSKLRRALRNTTAMTIV